MTNTKTDQPLHIALIGFGEVGTIFATGLSAHKHIVLSAYDLKFDQPQWRDVMGAKAAASGTRLCASAQEAAQNADLIISAVTADQVEAVAQEAMRYLKRDQMFFDINSASPSTKKKAALMINPLGAHYVEGAVMAPVPGPGLRVPILAGGVAADALCAILNPLGMNIEAVTTEPGRASAMKLCRSIMIKGIEALIIDCADAAEKWDVQKEVFASLTASFPTIDFAALSKAMAARVHQHGVRRAAEMREAAIMLEDLGLSADLARAVADAQERGARTPSHPPY